MIDFSRARLRDVSWWRRSNLLLRDLERDGDEKIVDASFRFHLALVANPSITEESWTKSKEAAADCFNELIAVLRPWGARTTEQRKQEEVAGLRDAYKRLLGDPTPGSDFYNNVILKEVARMNALMAAGRPEETPDERIDRRFKERILRQGRRP